MNSEKLNLTERTKENLTKIGYNQLTNIQEQVIPLILEGKDIIGQSQTGTGKTAAFVIPAVENLKTSTKPQILILVPTRELALQVSEETRKLSQHSKLRILAVYGGDSIGKQLETLRHGVDVVVGTPGRIIDHLQRNSLQTDNLKIVILDEVDEMIGKGFLEDIEKILKKTPKNRQTLLFSATISPEVAKFAQTYLKNPIKIIGKSQVSSEDDIEHYYLETPSRQKIQFLINFLRLNKSKLIIIFANTKRMVEEIKERISKERLSVDYIHSDLSQTRRTRIFNKFRNKEIKLLLATDVAARGLHISGIDYVINYDFPQTTEFYTHRVGRTGRAGAKGKAISLISSFKEKKNLMFIARQKGYRLEIFDLPSKEQVEQKNEEELIERISKFMETRKPQLTINNEKLKELGEKYSYEKLANNLFYLLKTEQEN